MKLLHFLRPYHGKCDCCKRLTRIQDKAAFYDNNNVVGEITLCPVCLSHFKKLVHTKQNIDPLAAEGVEEEIHEEENFDEITDSVYNELISNASSVERLI